MKNNTTYKRIVFGLLLGFTMIGAGAKEVIMFDEAVIGSPTLTRNGNLMSVEATFDFSEMHLNTNQAWIYTPLLVNGPDTLALPSVGVFGRTRWYQSERVDFKPFVTGDDIFVKHQKKMPEIEYVRNVAYQDWMNGASLIVRQDVYGCATCNKGEAYSSELMAYYEEELQPELIFEQPITFEQAVAEQVKLREISGRAYVDFPVNKIVIYPDYRNNTYELGKIIATIDSVKNDKDITVTSLHIAGTASPEGPYQNNVYLAKNRTKALKDYVQNLYNFPEGFITTSFEPVDWKGLSEWLEANNLANKEKILAIVNSDLEPFARNSKIKKDFPTEYDFLLRQVYPSLRHSDYVISFTIRGYTDLVEIREILHSAPQKLSLEEIYRYAASLQPGSDDYNEAFEVAVRMFPSDETANLNAANNALARKDLIAAERYLQRAGNSPKATYARGVLKGLQGNFEEGIRLLNQAKAQGLQGVDTMLENMIDAARFNKK